jgi:phosphatidylglycerophosphatase A
VSPPPGPDSLLADATVLAPARPSLRIALARAAASMAGLGHLRPAPGTWGSLAVLPCVLLGPLPCLLLALALLVLGLWSIRAAAIERDPSWVVIDEGCGMLIALAAVPPDGGMIAVLGAFTLFRLLDILKPGPIGWADRREGAVGIMLDDVMAGAIAAAGVLAAQLVATLGTGWAG